MVRYVDIQKRGRTVNNPVRLVGEHYEVLKFRLHAFLGNTDIVFFGDDTVSARASDENGRAIHPRDVTEWYDAPPGKTLDLFDYWIDVSLAGEGVTCEAQIAEAVDTAVAI